MAPIHIFITALPLSCRCWIDLLPISCFEVYLLFRPQPVLPQRLLTGELRRIYTCPIFGPDGGISGLCLLDAYVATFTSVPVSPRYLHLDRFIRGPNLPRQFGSGSMTVAKMAPTTPLYTTRKLMLPMQLDDQHMRSRADLSHIDKDFLATSAQYSDYNHPHSIA